MFFRNVHLLTTLIIVRMEGEPIEEHGRRRKSQGVNSTLFVDNLPLAMGIDWLRQIFKFEGDLKDAYLSRRHQKNNKHRFGFVRFISKEKAREVTRRMDGAVIRGFRMQVNLAKYERNVPRNNGVKNQIRSQARRDIRPFLSQRDDRSYKDVLINKSSKDVTIKSKQIWREKKHSKPCEETKIPRIIVVKGEVYQDAINYLHRSVIGEGLYPLDPFDENSR